MNEREFLNATADLLETGGVCRGNYKTEDGAYCTMGAMYKLVSDFYHHNGGFDPSASDAFRTSKIKLAGFIFGDTVERGQEHGVITRWNDYGPCNEEIIRTIRRVAAA